MTPLCFDLYGGLGGWAEGFLAEGYRVVGFDIERHRYPRRKVEAQSIKRGGSGAVWFDKLVDDRRRAVPFTGEWDEYPGQLVLQDVLTLHGSQFRNAAVIVASPPCQEFSYMAMPWKRGKQIAAALRGQGEFPEGYTGSRTIGQLTALFGACFRLQREACVAAGRYIPMVVENVRGAQPWVGQAKANYGSFYLWGDVAMVGRRVVCRPRFGDGAAPVRTQKFNPDETEHGFNGADHEAGVQGAVKVVGHINIRDGYGHTRHLTNQRESDAVKVTGDWFGSHADMKAKGTISPGRLHGKESSARKAASAQIAKIPLDLARYVARAFRGGSPA